MKLFCQSKSKIQLLKSCKNSIGELKSDIESLSRADVIAEKAQNDLKMVFTHPETLRIEIDPTFKANL